MSFAAYLPDPTSFCGEECVGESIITRFFTAGLDGRKLRHDGVRTGPVSETRRYTSPDGRFEAHDVEAHDCSRFAIRRRDGHSRTRIIGHGCRGSVVDWSPSSRSLLFVVGEPTRVPRCACPGEQDLWSIRVDGTHARRLTTFGGYINNPQWSPDGRWIVFGRDSNNVTGERRSGVWIVRATGGRPRLIVRNASMPAWQPLPRRPARASRVYATRIGGAGRNAELGFDVASLGDVNGDGLGDVAVSAPGARPRNLAFAGSVFVVFGRRKPAALADLRHPGRVGFRIDGPSQHADTGFDIDGAGDVNGDGRADILVDTQKGAYLVFGKADGAPINLAALGAGGYALDDAYDSLGGAGDVNGDGTPDLIDGSFGAFGTADVQYGHRDGPPTEGVFMNSGREDQAGAYVAGLGDVNGDGLADVAVSAAISGVTYVIFGSREGGKLDFRQLGGRGFKIRHAGHEVAGAGDVNGDGKDDVVVQTPYAAAVVYGKASTATVDATRPGTAGFVIRETFSVENFGAVAPAGDVNRDGLADVALTSSNVFDDAGYADVVCGSRRRPVRPVSIPQRSCASWYLGDVGDSAGPAIAGGADVNGDGRDDVVAGPGQNETSAHWRGFAFILYGGR